MLTESQLLGTIWQSQGRKHYSRASQTLLFCDPILEKKFPRDPWMNGLHVNDIKEINVSLQALACFVLKGERGAKH